MMDSFQDNEMAILEYRLTDLGDKAWVAGKLTYDEAQVVQTIRSAGGKVPNCNRRFFWSDDEVMKSLVKKGYVKAIPGAPPSFEASETLPPERHPPDVSLKWHKGKHVDTKARKNWWDWLDKLLPG